MEKSKGFDIAKLFRPVASVTTSIGVLYLYGLRTSDFDCLKNLPNTGAMPRIRAFIPSITSVVETKEFKEQRKPPGADDVSQLLDGEIEAISESYLQTVLSSKEDPTTSERPRREPNENATSYLDRLLKHVAEAYWKRMAALYENAIKSSDGTFDSVRKSSSALGSTLDAFQRLTKAATPAQIDMPNMDHLRVMGDQFARQKRERAEEMEMVRLTGQMTAESAKTLKDLAEAATTLLEQLDERDKKANESTRRQITIAVWSVGISAGLALIALVVALFGFYQDRSNIEAGDKWQTELLDAVRDGNRRRVDAEKQVQQLQKKVAELNAKMGPEESNQQVMSLSKKK